MKKKTIEFSVKPGNTIYSINRYGEKQDYNVCYLQYTKDDSILYFDDNNNIICDECSLDGGITFNDKLFFSTKFDRDYFAKNVMYNYSE